MSEIDDILKGAPEHKPGAVATQAAAPAPTSEIDQALKDAPAPARGFGGWARDIAATAVKGAIAVPEAVVGLADIPTGGAVGKFLENEGGAVGFRPKQAKEIVNDWHSDATKQAQQKFQEAEGLGGKLQAAIENPSVIATSIGESLPSMAAGGVAARGLMAATRLGKMGAGGAALAGAAGEGLTMAGSAAEQIRQETDDGLLTPGQAALAGATGLVGAAVGAAGGKVAQKLGIGDVDTMVAQGAKGLDQPVSGIANPLVQQQALKSIPKQIIQGAISEGFLEELPQSVAEQVFQNLALGKDWAEGVDAAIVLGTLSGAAMGGGAAGFKGAMDRRAPGQAPANPGTERVRQAYEQNLLALPAPQINVGPDGMAKTAGDRNARLRRIQDGDILDVTPIPKRSEQMGLNPAAGPMSAAAATAVDTGLTDKLGADASAQAKAEADADTTGVPVIDYADLSDDDRAMVDDFYRRMDEETRDFIRMGVEEDDGVPDFDAPGNASTEDFLRALGASEQEIQDAISTTSAPAGPLQSAAGNGAAAQDAASRPQEGDGADQAAQGQSQGLTATPTATPGEPANGTQATEAVQAAPQGPAQQPAGQGVTPPRGILAKKAAADAARAAGSKTNEQAAQPTTSATTAKALEPAATGRTGVSGVDQPQPLGALSNVQNTQSSTAGTEAKAAPVETRAPEGGNAAAAGGVPAAPGAGDVQADGVKAAAIAEAAHQAATSPKNDLPQPTEAQKEAGNYQKGHARIAGHDVTIENPAGSKRRPEWPALKNHYGYFKGSIGADKDHVDVFMTDRAGDEALPVFVVDQVNKDGTFDEHKVVMGAADEADARATYLQNYEKGWTGLGAITQMSQEDFKAWVRDPAKTKKPVALKRGVLAKMADQKRTAALDRIAKGTAYFGTKAKADEFITKSGIGDTHEVVQAKPGRFEIRVKGASGMQTADAAPAAAQAEYKDAKGRPIKVGDNVRYSSGGTVRHATIGAFGPNAEGRIVAYDTDGKTIGAPTRMEIEVIGATAAVSQPEAVNADSMTRAEALQALEDGKVLSRFGDQVWIEKSMAGKVETYVIKSRDADSKTVFTKGPVGPDRQWGWGRGDAAREAVKSWDFKPAQEVSQLVQAMNDLADVRARIANQGQVVDDRLLQRERQLKAMVNELESEGQNDELDSEMQAYERKAEAAKAPAPAKSDPLTEKEKAAKAKMLGAAAKLADLLSKNTRANITPEQEQKMLPIVIELFEGAMDLGYVKFKQAARYVREFIAGAIDQDAADSIPIDTLQGAYIATARRHADKDITPKKDVITVETIADLEEPAESADTGAPKDGNAAQQLDRTGTGALGGAPTQDVRAPDGGRDAGTGADRGGRSDGSGNPRADDAGRDAGGSLGGDAGAVPVPGRGTRAGTADAKEPRVPRARRAEPGDGLFGATGGLTPEVGANPAPNAPPIPAPQPAAQDFTITDELSLGEGGQKTKFKNNVAAIRLVRDLESTGRMATPEEQAVLAKYVGWGGLPQAFDPNNSDWAREYAELTDLMSPEDLADARKSTRYAHYTSREIIVDGIYAALRRFGFAGGKTLEAGAGVGNFIGLMPADMRSAGRFTAIEREPFSSAIARNLYPQQSVQRADFTEFKGTDAYYDAAVGNPPFASDPQTDRSGRKHLSGLSLHNYFFAKSIDMLREGGIMAQVVTNSFLDAKGDRARKYISDRAEFLGAIRLPNNAFSKNAGTEVTTDIIFLKKRPDSEVGGKAARADAKRWLDIGSYTDKNGKQVALNQYFIDNPEMMLGEFGAFGTMYGPEKPALVARQGQDTMALLKAAVERLPAGVYKSIAETGTANQISAAVVALKNPSVKEGGYFLDGDKLMQRIEDIAGEARGVEITPATQWTAKTVLGDAGFDRIKQLASMRATVRGLLAAEMADDTGAMETLRATLNQQYDAYRDAHGLINDLGTIRVFDDDPDFPLLASLEHGYTPGISVVVAKRMGVKPTKSTAKKGPIFTQRVVAARQAVQKVETPADALAVSMAERGKLDAAYIGQLLGMDPEAVLKELSTGDKPLLFLDPATDEYVLRDAYLSGNVRAKLAQAREAGMFQNVAELEAVQPEDVGSHEITARLGSPWVPTDIYRDFAKHLYGEDSRAVVVYLPANSSYQVFVSNGSEVAMTNTWGTRDYPGDALLQAIMNNRSVKVTYRDSEGKTHTDIKATEEANEKAQQIKEKFNDWLFSDPERSEILTKAYNETNNNYVTRVYDGGHMTFPGKVPDSVIKFRRHQRNAIARIVQDRTALLDHVVGAGKTFTVISGAMELKRTGLARKPMVAVPNHLVKQWAADFYRLYPGANVLTATKKDFETGNRRKFLAKIATGDWDAVVIAHSSFGFIKPAPEFEAEFNGREIQKIMATIKNVEDSDGEKQTKKRTIKQLEGIKERLENRIRQLRDKPMDDLLDFEQIGVDQLFVDEAHLFKNLMYTTKMQGVAGLNDPTGSQRAYDMYVKTNQVMEKNGRGQGVVFATGTPVSNSLAEMYHMMRYLMPNQMRELGFDSFDAWANTYASVEQVWMQAPSGDGFKAQNRMSNFVNTPELLKMFDQVSDTVTMDDIKKAYAEENDGAEFPLPKLKGGRRTPVSLIKSPAQNAYMAEIAKRAQAIEKRKGPPQKGDDNILVIMSDARKAAMDIRLVDPEATTREKGGRIDRSTDEVVARYKKYDSVKGTQIVFSDLGTPIKHAKKELAEYEALQARIQSATEDVAASAALGNEAAMETLEDAEAAQAELDAMGPDWLSAVKAALRGFSIYDDFKAALIEKGIPEAEIAFIHDYNTDDQKASLFRKVNAGQIRVLLGSTAKLGAGTNVQERLVAEHHLDVPWRPSDVEQREGRIERQGNRLMTEWPDFEIEILAYVTQDTLDMRMWQVQETKLKMINQLRTRKIGREIDNAFEDMELSAGEMQAAATGDINLLKEIQLRNDVKKLEQRRRAFDGQRNDLISRKRRNAETLRELPAKVAEAKAEAEHVSKYRTDVVQNRPAFKMNIDGKDYTDAAEAQGVLRALDEATEEVTDLAGEVKSKKKPLSVTIDGELIKNRATMAELYSNAAGDKDPIAWSYNGETYHRRTVLASAIRAKVQDAIADDTLQQVGSIGAYAVAVEGNGNNLLEVTLSRDGDVKMSNTMIITDTGKAADRVVTQAENLMVSALTEAGWLERSLERAKKDAEELAKVDVGGDWPDQAKLDAARAAHKEVLAQLKKKDEAAPAAAENEDDANFGAREHGEGSPADRAVMAMAGEGKSADEILRFIANASKSPFNRQVARLLRRTKANPSVSLGGDMGGGAGFRFLAKYSRKNHEVTLSEGAADRAEQIFLHETVHAATLLALDRGGDHAAQMQRLYESAKKQGAADGMYGMKNVGEFVAEAFTNPEFQKALKGMRAPGSAIWDRFVAAVRRILGLPDQSQDALSAALELGTEVMRENMPLRAAKSFRAEDAPAFAGVDQTETPAFRKWFGDSKVVDSAGKPLVVYHGTNAEFSAFNPETQGGGALGQGFYFAEDRSVAEESGSRLMPVYLSVKNPLILSRLTDDERVDWNSLFEDDPIAAQEKAIAEGYDSVLDDVYTDRNWVAFRPEQIKSATGNNGNFDSEDADIAHFGMADAATLKRSALDQIHQTLSHPGKVSVWDKTVGTMRNLAERSPAFKPVFEAAQRFIDDVSMLANEAADVAPRLLPRVESWRDLTKKPVSAEDNQAISKPLFEGTLMWARDTDGKPALVDDMAKKYANLSTEKRAKMLMAAGRLDDRVLRMWQGLPEEQFDALVNSRFESQMLKPGVVWADGELKSLFSLNDQQVSLYREARQAIDRSIDLTARADMLRALGAGYAGMRDAVLELPTLADARDLLVETLHADALDDSEQADRLTALINTIADRFEKATGLMKDGYAPLSRFGRYTVDVVDAEGQRQYFGMAESMRDANQLAERMRSEFPGATVTQGTMSAEAYKLFAGITPESLELFGNMLGLDAEGGDARDKAFQEYLRLTKNNHSALKRLMHRKGTAGYSEDVGRVLASFVYSNARQAAGGLNAGTMEEAVNAIPKEQGELKDVAMGLRDYVRDPQEEGQVVRGMLFAQYLGGSVASAFVNMTQPVAVTLPWLSQFGGMKSAGKHLASAFKDMAGRSKYEDDLQAALDRAEEDGVVSPQEIHQLMAQARGAGGLRSGDGTRSGDARAAASNAWERTKVAWGQPFALAEQFNRQSTFIAAYRMAKERGMKAPAEFARRAVLETQFLYCVDEQTECLTTDGWKNRASLNVGDVVIGVDANGKATETPLLALHSFPGRHQVVEFSNANRFSMVVTDGHRHVVQNYNSRDKVWQKPMIRTTTELRDGHHLMRVPVSEVARSNGDADFAALLGWVAAEGTYAKFRNCKVKRNVRLVQSSSHNPEYVAEIEALLQRLGGHYRRFETPNSLTLFTLKKPLSTRVLEAMPEKLLTWAMVASMGVNEMRATLDAFSKGDGHKLKEGGWVIGQKQEQNLHVLQAMAVLCGQNATMSPAADRDAGKIAHLYLHTQGKRTMVKQLTRAATEVQDGVWCPETGTGTWVARRNGAVFVTGNSKANKPKWARGVVGGTLFTFKTYSVSYLELLNRMATAGKPGSPERAAGRRAVAWAMGTLMLMGGAGGLPFMEDLEDLIDGIAQLLGYNVSAKQWRREVLQDVVGKEMADFIDTGVSGLPGAPIDVSGRLGMGNLIPGTGLLLSKQNRERDLLEVVGPAGDLVARGFTGARKALSGDIGGAALELSPTAVRNAAKGIDMAISDRYTDAKGYKVLDTTLPEAAAKAIGFQPRSVAEVQEANSFMLRSKAFYTQTSAEIKAQWARALFEKDDGALKDVRERLADWNRNNPDQPIVIKMPDVWKRVREMGKDRTQRIADTAPKALRQEMREMARGE